jgi:phosphate acyltransferase
MGSDHGPAIPVRAGIRAASELDIGVILVGDERQITSAINQRPLSAHLVDIVDAPEVVSMEDEAVSAVRRKRRASIPVGLELLKEHDADAFVSAGNTGGVVASSVVSLGRLRGVSRPGIAVPIPTVGGPPILLIDAGALSDPKPEHLWQHARLAASYTRVANGIEYPRVGLISNGEESTKGNALSRTTFQLLQQDPGVEFVGNVEARAIPNRPCDVLVTDGFTGNVILKTAEGVVTLVQESLRSELRSRWYTALLAALLKPAFRRAGRSLDYREYGGAPLLGVDGLVMIAHGSSDERAILNALRSASISAQRNTLAGLRTSIASPVHAE